MPTIVDPDPVVTATCKVVADTLRDYARAAYKLGDQRIGDSLSAHALAWEVAGAEGRLPAVPR